jgi:protein TonB
LTETAAPSTFPSVPSRRRHLLIWSAVTAAHLAAFAAVWSSGAAGVGVTPSREGGLMLVMLTPEPVALSGEQPQGRALGAGAALVAPLLPTAIAPTLPGPVGVAALLVAEPRPASVLAPVGLAGPDVAAPRPIEFTPPAFLERVEPVYPDRARRAGVEGVATVRIRLDDVGAILAVELVESSGHRSLDEAALTAARSSRFAPAARASAGVPSEALATYRFELR